MKTFSREELAIMQTELQQIADTSDNSLKIAERSCQTVQHHLQKLKEFMLSYEFKDTEEEIRFFKEIKPAFLNQLIYFREVFFIEANKPAGDSEKVLKHYKRAAQRVNIFFERNQHLHIYYRTGKTDQDATFFTRDATYSSLMPEYSLDIDARFSTLYSLKLSKLQAFDKLNGYIQNRIRNIENETFAADASQLSQASLPWTDKKAGLIEILYGIQSMGCLNNAKAELKEIARLFEVAFNVDLGNYSRTFQEIRIRKKGRTAFLDRMKEILIKRMDEADDYF